MTSDDTSAPAQRRDPMLPGGLSASVWIVLSLIAMVELILQAADLGFVGSRLWRGLAYQNGAFWSGLLTNWRPNYSGQAVAMFFTYTFLHAGLSHMVANMMALIALGRLATARVGTVGFWVIFALSTFGGGIAFGAMSDAPDPMVGTSGALFGLAGAWNYWTWVDRRSRNQSLWPVIWIASGLLALNLVMYWWMDGRLAWETHFGGFLAGWAAAALLTAIKSSLENASGIDTP